jgi:hypothetical protein
MQEKKDYLNINKRLENGFLSSPEKDETRNIKKPLKECKEYTFAHQDGSMLGNNDLQRIIKYFLLRETGQGYQAPVDLIIEAK